MELMFQIPARTTDTTNSLLNHIYTNEMGSDKLKFSAMKWEFSDDDSTFALIKSKTAEPKDGKTWHQGRI